MFCRNCAKGSAWGRTSIISIPFLSITFARLITPPSENYSLVVRMAALLHDVGKPKVKGGDGADSTFYQHEYVGARMAVKALDRLRFLARFVEQVAHLVRTHMFYYDTGVISPAGVRRFVVRVGPENIDDLIESARSRPHRLRRQKSDAVPPAPFTLYDREGKARSALAEDARAARRRSYAAAQLPQSRRVGWILNALMEEVIDDPKKNEKKYLEKRAKELNKLSDGELQELFASAQAKKREAEGEMDEDIKEETSRTITITHHHNEYKNKTIR